MAPTAVTIGYEKPLADAAVLCLLQMVRNIKESKFYAQVAPLDQSVFRGFHAVHRRDRRAQPDRRAGQQWRVRDRSERGCRQGQGSRADPHGLRMSLLEARKTYKPFEYPWAYDFWKRQQQIHWMPEEVPLGEDCRDWAQKLTEHERNLLTQIFRFFTQADVEVQNCYHEHTAGCSSRPRSR
jgi:hypothetical protein